MQPPQSAAMPTICAFVAARIRLSPLLPVMSCRLPAKSIRWTSIIEVPSSEAAAVFAARPLVAVLGLVMPRQLGALRPRQAIDELRAERPHQLGVGGERIEGR